MAKGAESYALFKKHVELATTLMNLYELYYALLRDGEEKLAEAFVERLMPQCLEITADDIKQAAHFRLKHSKKKFSYIDALGYILAIRHSLLFLTGDSAFEDIAHVKFIK